MKQQTAMQNLIKQIKTRMDLVPEDPNLTERGMYDAYLNCLNWAEKNLETEKQQIMDAVNHGCSDFGSAKDPEKYYNEIYNK